MPVPSKMRIDDEFQLQFFKDWQEQPLFEEYYCKNIQALSILSTKMQPEVLLGCDNQEET